MQYTMPATFARVVGFGDGSMVAVWAVIAELSTEVLRAHGVTCANTCEKKC
ncbi:predicted protein [Plenodomus lingam JN3]|uniref:Predicted protein n=1 Tax=Leptosphaeria maculans (strain JN3 / isolate v23.1.3 / race Av1-4-5-6-7-8) TaxID=985895 RepID=E4ZJ91_LEPMJ|nr:predicted protein [Plenodomus lingam JN3]CBX91522.1 predicted protein [Plenodomus lingam JN3]